MTQSKNVNSYLHDLDGHLSMTVQAAGRRAMVAVCECGWRSYQAKKPEAASRFWGQVHLKELQAKSESGRCSNCFRICEDDLCAQCKVISEIFA